MFNCGICYDTGYTIGANAFVEAGIPVTGIFIPGIPLLHNVTTSTTYTMGIDQNGGCVGLGRDQSILYQVLILVRPTRYSGIRNSPR
jgi:hypothetical protein